MIKKIRCSIVKCNNTITGPGDKSFDFIAESKNWKKVPAGYVCTECIDKQNSRRVKKNTTTESIFNGKNIDES
jgi:hypothetical protein